MHRFYLPPEQCTGDVLRLEGREAHHALHVLRVKRGEPVVVLDGAGHEFLCEVAGASRAAVTLRVKQTNFIPPPSCPITLLQAVPKGKIIESIIQKSVELGAHRIVPLSDRTRGDPSGRKGENAQSGRNGNGSPSKPSSNAARPGCRKLKRRCPSRKSIAPERRSPTRPVRPPTCGVRDQRSRPRAGNRKRIRPRLFAFSL